MYLVIIPTIGYSKLNEILEATEEACYWHRRQWNGDYKGGSTVNSLLGPSSLANHAPHRMQTCAYFDKFI